MGGNLKIKEKLDELDNSFPLRNYQKDEIWVGIEKRMQKRSKLRKLYITYTSIAATFLILALALIQTTMNGNTVTYFQSEESMNISSSSVPDAGDTEAEAIEFIENSCQSYQALCDSKEFKELKAELDQLDMEIKDLNEMISLYGEDELLIKSKIKIENHKSELTRKLVQILIT